MYFGINNYIILAKGETIGGAASNIDVGTIIHKVYNFLRVCKSRTLIGMFGWILEIIICMGANLFSSYPHFRISAFRLDIFHVKKQKEQELVVLQQKS